MENNTPPSKLDETLKDRLGNYDAKYDSGDWARMERMLEAAPKSITPKGSYNMALIIGGIVLVGGFAIYKGVTSTSGPETEPTPAETTVTSPENKTETVVKTTPAPAPVVNTAPPVVKETQVIVPETKTTLTPPVNTTVVATENKPANALVEKKKTESKTKTGTTTDSNKTQKVSVMGNEPVFGDMIDSSKGIIHKTKEKESTKKAAVEKGTKSSVGLNSLFNLNADSLRKQKEMMQKDTTKN